MVSITLSQTEAPVLRMFDLEVPMLVQAAVAGGGGGAPLF
jgi:hypothetical protein